MRLSAATEASAPADADERAVLSFLRSRHTGLSSHDEENVARAVVAEARKNDLIGLKKDMQSVRESIQQVEVKLDGPESVVVIQTAQ